MFAASNPCLPDERQNWEQPGTCGNIRENTGARGRLFSLVPGCSGHWEPQEDRRKGAAVLSAAPDAKRRAMPARALPTAHRHDGSQLLSLLNVDGQLAEGVQAPNDSFDVMAVAIYAVERLVKSSIGASSVRSDVDHHRGCIGLQLTPDQSADAIDSRKSQAGIPEMAARNPPWEYDEILLVLDLYLDGRKVLEEDHPAVVALSHFLKTLPLHPDPGSESFRSPDAVVLKLANLRAHDPTTPSVGMNAGGRRTREIWERFGGNAEEVRRLADAIRSVSPSMTLSSMLDEDNCVPEGRLLVRRHRERERNSRVVRQRREQFAAANGRLFCEACGFEPGAYGDRADGVIECHHIRPLSEGGERRTRLEDLLLLCANCHRAVHAKVPWLRPDALRALLIEAAPAG
jgi:5-methylcytosine-specific restriction enzyme A